MCDKVQEIIDTFYLLSPENQNTLLKCTCNTFEAEKSVKEPIIDTPGLEKQKLEEGDTSLKE